ncbi:hypothetical protein [Cohnella thailandensis]|uniref:Uncharacterized protein n=1 Tax=Cohnella thailandensis TaxID=557557 RepID=A0A841SVD0_9BACL|nr:hypothetical protein [Cohnella thailandensis]MBB6636263.1 hypothetical protein [Cohnella thailandensis]MBP1973768.1 hypothetical protein [Cohnella thailandensis]
MAIAERVFPDHLNIRLSEDIFKAEPARLHVLMKRGAERNGARLAACPESPIHHDFIAAERPIGQLFAAVKKAQ